MLRFHCGLVCWSELGFGLGLYHHRAYAIYAAIIVIMKYFSFSSFSRVRYNAQARQNTLNAFNSMFICIFLPPEPKSMQNDVKNCSQPWQWILQCEKQRPESNSSTEPKKWMLWSSNQNNETKRNEQKLSFVMQGNCIWQKSYKQIGNIDTMHPTSM